MRGSHRQVLSTRGFSAFSFSLCRRCDRCVADANRSHSKNRRLSWPSSLHQLSSCSANRYLLFQLLQPHALRCQSSFGNIGLVEVAKRPTTGNLQLATLASPRIATNRPIHGRRGKVGRDQNTDQGRTRPQIGSKWSWNHLCTRISRLRTRLAGLAKWALDETDLLQVPRGPLSSCSAFSCPICPIHLSSC